jgi:membrane protease YdiL (CAAX protease family)
VWLRPASKAVLGWGAALAFCLYWLVSLVLSGLPESWTNSYAEVSSSLDQTGALAFLTTAIVAPVVEEVLFRGLIFTRLRSVCPGWAAIVISAAVFGACHGEFIWFCYAFFLGVIFALLVEMTGSILPSMVMHLVFNTTNEVYAILLECVGTDGSGAFYVVFRAVLPFVLATVGTVFCALRLRGAVSASPVPFVSAEPQEPLTASEAVSAVQSQETPRPSGAAWDRDSGPNHKFPPQRM